MGDLLKTQNPLLKDITELRVNTKPEEIIPILNKAIKDKPITFKLPGY